MKSGHECLVGWHDGRRYKEWCVLAIHLWSDRSRLILCNRAFVCVRWAGVWESLRIFTHNIPYTESYSTSLVMGNAYCIRLLVMACDFLFCMCETNLNAPLPAAAWRGGLLAHALCSVDRLWVCGGSWGGVLPSLHFWSVPGRVFVQWCHQNLCGRTRSHSFKRL